MSHTFHIPVLGLAYSVDTPLKVARYGISSVASIVDDISIERIRKYYTEQDDQIFVPIDTSQDDYRAKRITAYLNMMNKMVKQQIANLKSEEFEDGKDIVRYFELLPETSSLKKEYQEMLGVFDSSLRAQMQRNLREKITAGSIDVNIMSKVDKINIDKNGEILAEVYSDALAALRGFAESDLNASLVLSAGMNPRLYGYLETFPDFFPDENHQLKKKIILKVSDFRSAFIQAKFLAKKGIWVSEFRVESGLNCGGHAFATEGYLLGPILEEFKMKRAEMQLELFGLYQSAIENKGMSIALPPAIKMSVQGGIGTYEENSFLLEHYNLDATGWGSPFLLVPEATNVDADTLNDLATADESDYYISGSSPLGIPFNNFRKSSGESQRLERVAKNRPGSPCIKKFLVSNTEFTEQPICTASREYQNLKIKQLQKAELPAEIYQQKFDVITEKVCLCDGLVTSYFIKHNLIGKKDNRAVTICPGPNLAYFSRTFTLDEMVKHIYGQVDLLEGVNRPHMFINELKLYIDYLKKDIAESVENMNTKKEKYLNSFKSQLQNGIQYYKGLLPQMKMAKQDLIKKFNADLLELELKLNGILLMAE